MGILDIIVFLPILGAVICFAGLSPRLVALSVSGANLLLGIYLYFWSRGHEIGENGYLYRAEPAVISEFPEIIWSLGIDGMALVLVLLAVLVTFAAVWVTPRDSGHDRLLYAGSLLISAGALGAFLSTDVFFFYAFHELALIPTFLLIGLCGYGERRAAAWKITIYLGAGSLVLLAGLAALVASVGGEQLTFDMVKLKEAAGNIDPGRQSFVFALLFLGFGILVSLFPFHSWAPAAYASAPTPVAMLHSGVLKKFGLYGLIRLAWPILPDALQAPWVLNLVLILLLGNIIIVGLVTIAQTELDRLLANSSVMHMGYIFLGVVSYNAVGTAGAVLLMFAHGVSIALLFALAGHMRDGLGSLRFQSAGGLGKVAPLFTLAFGAAAFASIGLPGFANFAGEAMVFLGAFKDMGSEGFGPLQWATVLAVWGVVISAVYMLRAFRAMFQGEREGPASAAGATLDARPGWKFPAVLLIAALLIIGIFPSLFTRFLPQDEVPAAAAVAPKAQPAAHSH